MTIWERIKIWFMMLFFRKEEDFEEVYSEMQRIRKENNLP